MSDKQLAFRPNPDKPAVMKRTVRRNGVVIRKGNRKPYKKATNEQIEARIIEIAQLIRNGKNRIQIHKICCDKFGVRWDQIDKLYVPRAKKWLRDRARITPEEARAKGIDRLLEIIETGTPREIIAAESRIAEIMGYNAPKQHRLGGPDGKPLPPAVVAPTVIFSLPDNQREKK